MPSCKQKNLAAQRLENSFVRLNHPTEREFLFRSALASFSYLLSLRGIMEYMDGFTQGSRVIRLRNYRFLSILQITCDAACIGDNHGDSLQHGFGSNQSKRIMLARRQHECIDSGIEGLEIRKCRNQMNARLRQVL